MEYKVQINSLENFKSLVWWTNHLEHCPWTWWVDTLTVICEDIFSGDTPTEDKSMTGSGLIQILSTKL